jgi:hypothetical protein
LVLASAVLALCTLCSALYTAACAEGTLPADAVEAPEPAPPLEPPAPEPPAAEAPEPPAAEVLGAPAPVGFAELVVVCVGVWLGVVEVGVLTVVVVVVVGVVLVGAMLVPVPDVVVGVVSEALAGVVVTSEMNWAVPAPENLSDAFVVDELPCAEANWSWAAVSVCSAWSRAS